MTQTATRRTWYLWPVAAALASLVLTVQEFRDPDVWWHLALGRYIVEHGIPSAEPFSFVAPAHAWVDQQWLYEVSLFRVTEVGGPGLAALLMGVLGAAALLVAVLAAPRRWAIPGPWSAACLLGTALVTGQVLGVRGQVVTAFGVAAVLLILSRWRAGSSQVVWALPPLLLLWCNLHAGFIAGLVIPVVVLTVHRRRPGDPPINRRSLFRAIVVAGLATLLTPAGFDLYPYLAQTFTNPTLTQNIVEWMSPNFHELYPRLLEVEVLVLLAVWVLSDGPELVDVVLAGGALVATLHAQRNVAIFAIIALPQLLRYGAEAWHRYRPRRSGPASSSRATTTLAVATAATAVGSVIAIAPGLSRQAAAAYEATTYPRGAVDHVQTTAAGRRVYTTYEMGGYLAYRLPAGRVVFLYGESAIFGDGGLQRYLGIHLLRPGWPAALATERLQHAIVPASSAEMSALRELGWSIECRDFASQTVVMSLEPQAPPAAAVANRHGAATCL